MKRINRISAVISILMLVIVSALTITSGNVIIGNNYNEITNGILPSIIYNNSIDYYETITIYNYQSVPTVKNFQMLINISWDRFSNLLNPHCSNVRFYNNTSAIGETAGYWVLPAWIETNDNFNSISSSVWINLSGTIIPAKGFVKIYMGFLPKNVNFNNYLGVNPYLSNNYGKYDNGKYVFLLYNNGQSLMPLSNAGTGGSAPTITSLAPSPYNYAIEGQVNGGTANANTWSTNGINLVSNPSFNLPNSYIAQMRVYITGTSPLTDLLTNVNSITKGQFYVFRFDARGGNNYDAIGYYKAGASSTTFLKQTTQSKTNVWYQMTAVDNSDYLYLYKSSYANNGLSFGSLGSLIANTKGVGYTGGGIAVTTDGAYSTDYWTMIIVRNYPPNGIMPSYYFSNAINQNQWNTSLNLYKDQAYTTINSTWSSGIYCDDNGNTFWTDTYGNVDVMWNGIKGVFSLGSPYNYFGYAGQITSIAAVNYTIGGHPSSINERYVILLTYYGYVFLYNMSTDMWFNATSLWQLNLENYPGPWTSVTSNVNGYSNHHDEGFTFTNLSGGAYFYDTTNPYQSGWLVTGNPNLNLVSTAESYQGYLYSVSFNGNVYHLAIKNQWEPYANTGLNGIVGITMYLKGNNVNILLIASSNKTQIYQSSTPSDSVSGIFTPSGSIPFTQGSNQAITFNSKNNSVIVIQTNGTLAFSKNMNLNGWKYVNNKLNIYSYSSVLGINSTYNINFDSYASLVYSNDYTNMYNFTLYFIDSNGFADLEYTYQSGVIPKNPEMPAILRESNGILINLTLMPNSSLDSQFNFMVIFYPAKEPSSVIIEYIMDITIINHFNYEG
jgi:hypothetical protein